MLGESLHRVDVSRRAGGDTVAALVRFLDPDTREPRRVLPILLEAEHFRVNGFALVGDEIVDVISADPSIVVQIRRRGALYRAARYAAEGAARLLGRLAGPRRTGPLPRAPAPRPPLAATPKVSLVIPTRDRADLLEAAARTLFQEQDYPDVELVVVDNGSVEAATQALFDDLRRDSRISVVSRDEPFNFAALCNAGAAAARGAVLAFVNNDVEALDRGWLFPLVEQALKPEVGVVGTKLLYPDGTIQHAGITLGVGGLVGHSGRGLPHDAPGPGGMLAQVRRVSAVTAACLLTRRDVFERLGGFDERYVVEFNDVDYCLRVRALGLATLCAPTPLLHKEGATRGGPERRPSVRVMEDRALFMRQWGGALVQDSHFPEGLSRRTEALPPE